jgi:hypothetical protein
MKICNRLIKRGFYLRIIITIIIFIILVKYYSKNKYLLIILAILLTLLDFLDNVFTRNNKICNYIFYYQISDKINDLLSYLLVYLFFPLNNIFLILLIYRAMGVLLFIINRNYIWLIVAPDLFKEYLIYVYIFKSNNTYLPILILFKCLFEWNKHSHLLKTFSNYKLMNKQNL